MVTDMEDTTAVWEWVWAEDMAEGDTEEDTEDVEGDMEGAMDGGGSRSRMPAHKPLTVYDRKHASWHKS